MQLWDYQEHNLLVVRCRSCKMNYTFTKSQSTFMHLIFSQLDGVSILMNTIIKYGYKKNGLRLLRELAIDQTKIQSDKRPLAFIYFTAHKKEESGEIEIKDIFINEWKVVLPNDKLRLVS